MFLACFDCDVFNVNSSADCKREHKADAMVHLIGNAVNCFERSFVENKVCENCFNITKGLFQFAQTNDGFCYDVISSVMPLAKTLLYFQMNNWTLLFHGFQINDVLKNWETVYGCPPHAKTETFSVTELILIIVVSLVLSVALIYGTYTGMKFYRRLQSEEQSDEFQPQPIIDSSESE